MNGGNQRNALPVVTESRMGLRGKRPVSIESAAVATVAQSIRFSVATERAGPDGDSLPREPLRRG